MQINSIGQLKYRYDIEGLRAIAVISVIIYHYFPEIMQGGFLGVDIFFVISGYLISKILLNEIYDNKFSFIQFYTRRVTRIFPSLIVLFLFVTSTGWILLLNDEYTSLLNQVRASIIFSINFHLLYQTNYFDMAADLKPLLHLWSLAIEEQFYILYPLLIYSIIKYGKNQKIIIIILIIASFVAFFFIGLRHPEQSFYYPFTRIWELMIGAYVSILKLNKSKNNEQNFFNENLKRYTNVELIFLIILFIYCLFFSTQKEFSTGISPLIITILTARLIYLKNSNINIIISKSFFCFFGAISYPLYLFHWPILSFQKIYFGQDIEFMLKIISITLTITLSYLSYHFLEKPIRSLSVKKYAAAILVTLSCIFFIVTIFISKDSIINSRIAASPTIIKNGDINGNFDDVFNNNILKCKNKYKIFSDEDKDVFCVNSNINAKKNVIIIGDSHAQHLFYGLKKYYDEINFIIIASSGLPLINSKKFDKIIKNIIDDKEISTVIISAYWHPKISKYINRNQFIADFENTISILNSSDKKIYLLSDTPNFSFNPTMCKYIRPFSNSFQCNEKITYFENQYNDYIQIFKKNEKIFKNLNIINIHKYFCSNKECFMADDNEIFYRDRDHLNVSGSIFLGKNLKEDGILFH